MPLYYSLSLSLYSIFFGFPLRTTGNSPMRKWRWKRRRSRRHNEMASPQIRFLLVPYCVKIDSHWSTMRESTNQIISLNLDQVQKISFVVRNNKKVELKDLIFCCWQVFYYLLHHGKKSCCFHYKLKLMWNHCNALYLSFVNNHNVCEKIYNPTKVFHCLIKSKILVLTENGEVWRILFIFLIILFNSCTLTNFLLLFG